MEKRNMSIIAVDSENIQYEHICCAISDKKGENCVGSKKEWMRERFADGLVFKKLDERGKVFIEYIPAEYAFSPINAVNYMHINCFWVSGKFRGQGYANLLLEECITDAKVKGKDGWLRYRLKRRSLFYPIRNILNIRAFAFVIVLHRILNSCICRFTQVPPFRVLMIARNRERL